MEPCSVLVTFECCCKSKTFQMSCFYLPRFQHLLGLIWCLDLSQSQSQSSCSFGGNFRAKQQQRRHKPDYTSSEYFAVQQCFHYLLDTHFDRSMRAYAYYDYRVMQEIDCQQEIPRSKVAAWKDWRQAGLRS